MQACDKGIEARVSIAGDYEHHECGLHLARVGREDQGVWECEVRLQCVAEDNCVLCDNLLQMEEYVFGDLLSGAQHRANFTLVVSDHDQPAVLVQRSYTRHMGDTKKRGSTEDMGDTEDRGDTEDLVDENDKSFKAGFIKPDLYNTIFNPSLMISQ